MKRAPVVSVRDFGRQLYRLTDRSGKYVNLRLEDFEGIERWARKRRVRAKPPGTKWITRLLHQRYPGFRKGRLP